MGIRQTLRYPRGKRDEMMILLFFVGHLFHSLWILSYRRVVTTLQEGSFIPRRFFPIEFRQCSDIKNALDMLVIFLRDKVSNYCKDSLSISVLHTPRSRS